MSAAVAAVAEEEKILEEFGQVDEVEIVGELAVVVEENSARELKNEIRSALEPFLDLTDLADRHSHLVELFYVRNGTLEAEREARLQG